MTGRQTDSYFPSRQTALY